jgi:hypothetical protein
MRIRNVIIRICVVAGLIATLGGLAYAWQTDEFFAGTLWAVFGVGLMASAGIYSLALDDPQARSKALGHRRDTEVVDVRDSTLAPPVDVYDDDRVTVRH